MKRTAELSALQMDAWHAVLGGFKAEVINGAVVEMVLTDNRFPELGDLYQICRRIAIQRGDLKLDYSPHGTGAPENRPSIGEIAAVAQRLGLDI